VRRAAALWQRRGRRERVLLAGLAAGVGAYLAATQAVAPLLAARADGRAAIARNDAALARLAALPEDAAPRLGGSDGRPVVAVATDTAAEHGLTIRSVEGDGGGARLELADAGFAELVLWIEVLERDHGLRAVALEMERRPEPGVVASRLTLAR
jgi:general secretion pathway protein M